MTFERPRQERRGIDNNLQALRREIKNNPDDTDAVERLQRALERADMRGAFVPVETSAELAKDGASTHETRRWVEWKRVYDADGQEIPGRIEKIVRVKLIAEPVETQIDKGQYNNDWLSERLTTADREIPPQSGEQELFLPQFDNQNVVVIEDIETWLDQNGLRGATLQELLAVGAQLPEEQRRVDIIALDEAWRSRGRVPVLGRHVRERALDVDPRGSPWHQSARPLAARKFVSGTEFTKN